MLNVFRYLNMKLVVLLDGETLSDLCSNATSKCNSIFIYADWREEILGNAEGVNGQEKKKARPAKLIVWRSEAATLWVR